jgi:hypothetical protein
MNRKIKIGPLELSRTDITERGDLYMRRWVAEIPALGGVRLHKIVRPDADRNLHDHPFDFVSIVLWGHYAERVAGLPGERVRRTGSIRYFRAEHLHRITWGSFFDRYDPRHDGPPCWTLCISGPRRRVWGFHTAGGWVDYRTYLKEHRP